MNDIELKKLVNEMLEPLNHKRYTSAFKSDRDYYKGKYAGVQELYIKIKNESVKL